jgi:phage-related protein (TIGR01555 family)
MEINNSLKGFKDFMGSQIRHIDRDLSINADTKYKLYKSDKLLRKIITKPITTGLKNFLDYTNTNNLQEIHTKDKIKETLFYIAESVRIYGNIIVIYNDGREVDQAPTSNFQSFIAVRSENVTWHDLHEGTRDYKRVPEVTIEVNGVENSYLIHQNRWIEFNFNSELEAVYQATTSLNIAINTPVQLIESSQVDILRLKGLAQSLSQCQGEKECKEIYQKLYDRLQTMYSLMDSFKLIPMDSEEEIEKITKNLSGYKDIQEILMIMVSAISEIPSTVLFGKSPSGFQGGDHELENYHDYVSSEIQDKIFTPVINLYNANKKIRHTIIYDSIRTETKEERLKNELSKADLQSKRASLITTLLSNLSGEVSDEDIIGFVFEGKEIRRVEHTGTDFNPDGELEESLK